MPENLRTIRRKIRTVQNIWKITRAMKMVAAAKLRRVQSQVENGRVYWERLHQIISHVAAEGEQISHPLLEPRHAEAVGVLVIGGDRGLCGSYNVALLRHAQRFVESLERPVALMTVGPKAQQFFTRQGWDIEQEFATPDEEHRLLQAREIARILRESFLSDRVGDVHVVYTRFHSVIHHIPTARQLLPIQPPERQDERGVGTQHIFEPPADQLLASLLPRAIDAMVYEMLLQSVAAEEGARMAAMTAATDNAEEMTVTLKRDLNRARQTQITSEILEVVGGANALVAQ